MKEFYINQCYWTLQGEGFHTGRRALFVRMPFCSLDCSWCDTEFKTYKKWSLEDFQKIIQKEESRFAVLTGGEPSIHPHTPHLISILKEFQFEVAMETNGCHPIMDSVDFLTISPKRDSTRLNKKPYFIHEKALEKVSEFKYVIDKEFDFEVLNQYTNSTNSQKNPIHYYLSPEYSDFMENIKTINAYIAQNPLWRLSLQTHKWIGIE